VAGSRDPQVRSILELEEKIPRLCQEEDGPAEWKLRLNTTRIGGETSRLHLDGFPEFQLVTQEKYKSGGRPGDGPPYSCPFLGRTSSPALKNSTVFPGCP
jgi:hypothetical protein